MSHRGAYPSPSPAPPFRRNSGNLVKFSVRNSTLPRYTPPMVRSELVALLASHFPALTVKDAEQSVSVILTAIADRLAEGGRVELRGFGVFSLTLRPARMGHNPATGAPVAVPAKYALYFKPGHELRDRVAAAANGEGRSAPAKVGEVELEPG